MRTFGKWLGRLLLMLVLAGAVVGYLRWDDLQGNRF